MARRLGYIGDDTPSESQILSQAFNIAAQLRAANQRIIALENAIRQSPDVARAIAGDVNQARQQYSDLATKFVYAYTAVTGSTPDGLSALPIATLIYAAAVFVAVMAGLGVLSRYIGTLELNQRAALQAAQTRQALAAHAAAARQAAVDAAANGDSATAAQQSQIAQDALDAAGNTDPNPGGSSFTAFFTQNALLIGGGLAALVLLRD